MVEITPGRTSIMDNVAFAVGDYEQGHPTDGYRRLSFMTLRHLTPH